MLNKISVRLCDLTRRLLQVEPRVAANKPGTLARKMDRYGFRLICFCLIFLLLLQFGLTLGAAFFGALVLLVGLQLALKSDKPKHILKRVRRVSQAELEQKVLEAETADKKVPASRRYLSPLFTGLVLMGFGWLWSGGWGFYFISIGLINFALAGLMFLGQRKMKTELTQNLEN
jgi:hypothetical protein